MKLVVEVVDAHDLTPKDGQGSANPFVEVDFGNQLSRTRTILKNLNPVWNQKLVFHFDKTQNHYRQFIDVSVYNKRRPIPGRNFLGRVRLPCSNLARLGEEEYQTFPLEKKWFSSYVKGEIGLKVYLSPEINQKPLLFEPPPQLKSQPLSSSTPSRPKITIPKVTIPDPPGETTTECSTPDSAFSTPPESPLSSNPSSPRVTTTRPRIETSVLDSAAPTPKFRKVVQFEEPEETYFTPPESSFTEPEEVIPNPPKEITLRSRRESTVSNSSEATPKLWKVVPIEEPEGESVNPPEPIFTEVPISNPPRQITPRARRETKPQEPETAHFNPPEVPTQSPPTQITRRSRTVSDSAPKVRRFVQSEEPEVAPFNQPESLITEPGIPTSSHPPRRITLRSRTVSDSAPKFRRFVQSEEPEPVNQPKPPATEPELPTSSHPPRQITLRSRTVSDSAPKFRTFAQSEEQEAHFNQPEYPTTKPTVLTPSPPIQITRRSRTVSDSASIAPKFRNFVQTQEPEPAPFYPPEAPQVAHQVYRHQAEQQPLTMRRQAAPQIHPSHQEDFELKDTNPMLGERWRNGAGKGWMGGERSTSSYDLVEEMFYLYVRVVKAKDLPPSAMTAGCDPYVEVKLGNYRGRTRHYERKTNPEWNQVFAFSKERIQSSVLEVFVKDREMVGRDEYLGRVLFDLNEIPTRVPPDSPLAPQWYRLENRRGEGKLRGEVMVAVWMGTQADEAFPDAWHADAASVHGEGVSSIRSKVYVSPKLWYLRVNVIEAQDVVPNDKTRMPEIFVNAQVGSQVLKTKISPSPTLNPLWNEDLIFVVAEPFEEHLVLTVEDRVHPSKDDVLGRITLPLNQFEKRLDHRPVNSRWFNLERFGFGVLEADRRRDQSFSSRIHIRACLEGGYHVLDESTLYISDQRPTARQLWKQPTGMLEVGILGAQGLLPMKMKDGRGSTDSYVVARYGQKWVRTRTILNSFSPTWNEQYTWEVYDPCTVITMGVFDNSHLGVGTNPGRDLRIGKVRIRLSSLEANRVYTHSYPLLVLHPSGVKKMGELQLAVRFTNLSLANMIYLYGHPLLPKMHYLHPLTVNQVDNLRYQSMNIVAARLGRAEPPLRKEVVEYMLDVDSHMWSMRRSKANFFRIMSLLSGSIWVSKWLGDVCNWKNPITTVLVHILFLILIWYPELILPTMFLYMFLIGVWNYRVRPRHPPHMDTRLSWAEAVHPDELDEEFDTFPSSKPQDLVRMRYDRLRSVAGRIQTVVGDIATQGERVQSVLSWRDPRATSLFIGFCLGAAIVLYMTPFRVVALAAGLYMLRHPKFRSKLPSVPSNFFRRLPARSDSLL